MSMRIYEIKTETLDGKPWNTYRVAAVSADLAIALCQKQQNEFKTDSGKPFQRVNEIRMLAKED